MRFNQESDPSNYSIRAYHEDYIDVIVPITEASNAGHNMLRLTTSFLMSPRQLIQDWKIDTAQQLNPILFDQILALRPEIILLGTGQQLVFPDAAITQTALSNGIGVESMDSSAACRTYNILMLEGREVVLALISCPKNN